MPHIGLLRPFTSFIVEAMRILLLRARVTDFLANDGPVEPGS